MNSNWLLNKDLLDVLNSKARSSSSMAESWGACCSRARVHVRKRYFYELMRRGHGTGGCIAASLMHPGFSLVLLLLFPLLLNVPS